jgi:hypothetical protein
MTTTTRPKQRSGSDAATGGDDDAAVTRRRAAAATTTRRRRSGGAAATSRSLRLRALRLFQNDDALRSQTTSSSGGRPSAGCWPRRAGAFAHAARCDGAGGEDGARSVGATAGRARTAAVRRAGCSCGHWRWGGAAPRGHHSLIEG